MISPHGDESGQQVFEALTREHLARRICRAPAPFQFDDLDVWYQASRQAHASHLRAYGPEEQVVGRTFSDEVASALADLPPDFRTVVLLADLEGYAYREIADLVDCPIGTVMSRPARGRKLLREMLRDYARKHGLIEG
jgi:RNA polymerase sigma-70 factor (ECF subfamily)